MKQVAMIIKTDISMKTRMGKTISNLILLVHLIVIVECLQLTKKHLRCSKCITVLRENVIMAHEQLYNHVNSKMQKTYIRFKIV